MLGRRLVRGGVTRRALFAAAASLPAAVCSAAAEDLGLAIRATYLVKFGGFVEWPQTAFASPTSPLVLCIAGHDPFGPLLDRAAAGQLAGRHPIEVRRLPTATHSFGCHILYATGAYVEAGLAAVQRDPVLTVTERPPSAQRKGIINFIVQDYRVRFEIDGAAAAESGLRISSQLLALAVNHRQ